MIKVSDTKYVKAKVPHPILGSTTELCIPTGKKRVEGDEVEAEFFFISGNHPERLVWLRRDEIY
jgi:hypothetical protein